MAVLSDVYKTKNNREITLTPWQASVFEATIEKFKQDGVGGDDVFEETYVLQKAIAEYITGNLAKGGGNGEVPIQGATVYNAILGIETVAPVAVEPEVTIDDIVKEEEVVTKEKNIKFRDMRDKDAPFRPKSMKEYLDSLKGAPKLEPGTGKGRGGIKGGGTQAINTSEGSTGKAVKFTDRAAMKAFKRNKSRNFFKR